MHENWMRSFWLLVCLAFKKTSEKSSGSFPELSYVCSFHISTADGSCPFWIVVRFPSFMSFVSLGVTEPLFPPEFPKEDCHALPAAWRVSTQELWIMQRGCRTWETWVCFPLLRRGHCPWMYLQRAVVFLRWWWWEKSWVSRCLTLFPALLSLLLALPWAPIL